MAMTGNTLVKRNQEKVEKSCSFTANGEEVTLSASTVKRYLVSGSADRVTDQEVVMFINLCKYNGLNPWLKEAYCIKYGNNPATMVVGKETFQKRADADPNYDGQQAGVIVLADGEVRQREGCLVLPGEQLVGGWAKVYRKDRAYPSTAEVSLDEYIGRKSDGSANSQWSSKPATMIRKVALVQALREAFPARLGAMYAAEERGVSEPDDPSCIEVTEPAPPIAERSAPDPEDDFFAGTEA